MDRVELLQGFRVEMGLDPALEGFPHPVSVQPGGLPVAENLIGDLFRVVEFGFSRHHASIIHNRCAKSSLFYVRFTFFLLKAVHILSSSAEKALSAAEWADLTAREGRNGRARD